MITAKLTKIAQAPRTELLNRVGAKVVLALEPGSVARHENPLALTEWGQQIRSRNF